MTPERALLHSVLATSALSAVSAAALADAFSWELAGASTENEVDRMLDTRRDALLATYHFDPVDDSHGPYALAPFLDPASRVSLGLSREKRSPRPITIANRLPGPPAPLGPITPRTIVGPVSIMPPDLVGTSKEYSLRGRHLLPRSKWYFGGGYTETTDLEMPSAPRLIDVDAEGYELLVGKYLGEATTIELARHTERTRSAQTSSFCVVGSFCVEAVDPLVVRREIGTTRLSAQRVLRGRSLTYSLSGSAARTSGESEVHIPELDLTDVPSAVPGLYYRVPGTVQAARTSVSDLGSFNVYSVSGEIFPTAKLGVRLGYSRWSGESAVEDAYDVGITWFFKRSIGLQFSYARQTSSSGLFDVRSETSAVRAVGRL